MSIELPTLWDERVQELLTDVWRKAEKADSDGICYLKPKRGYTVLAFSYTNAEDMTGSFELLSAAKERTTAVAAGVAWTVSGELLKLPESTEDACYARAWEITREEAVVDLQTARRSFTEITHELSFNFRGQLDLQVTQREEYYTYQDDTLTKLRDRGKTSNSTHKPIMSLEELTRVVGSIDELIPPRREDV